MVPASPRPTPPDGNLLAGLPADLAAEDFQNILRMGAVRIERIVSHGHSSPAEGWWDQAEHEWILVLRGGGTLLFADGRAVTLRTGDHLFIPAHARHKVTRTDPAHATVWLAVFWS